MHIRNGYIFGLCAYSDRNVFILHAYSLVVPDVSVVCGRFKLVHVVLFTWHHMSQSLPDLKHEQLRELQAPLHWQIVYTTISATVTTWNRMQWRCGPGVHAAVGLASWINAVNVILVVFLSICKSVVAGNSSRSVVRYLLDNTPWTHCSSCISGSSLRMILQNRLTLKIGWENKNGADMLIYGPRADVLMYLLCTSRSLICIHIL